MSALQEGQRLVEQDRNETYGDPNILWEMVAEGWSQIFGTQIDKERCILAMIWLKTVREVIKPAKDNRDDMGGYLHILDTMRTHDK